MGQLLQDKELEKTLEENEEELRTKGCGVCNGCGGFCGWMDRNRLTGILLFAATGLAIGIGLSYWEPEDPETKQKTMLWLGLIGDLFLRALKCFVLPLVFVSVIIAVVEMMDIGKASSIGWTVIGLYLFTTIMAGIFGVLASLMFQGLYTSEEFPAPSPAYVQFACTEPGTLMAEGDDGNVMCSADYTPDDPNVNFIVNDVSGTFVTAVSGPTQVSLSDTVYQGIFMKMFTDNIFQAFQTSNFVAVIVFSIIFGVALSRVIVKAKGKDSFLLQVLKETDACLAMILLWIIAVRFWEEPCVCRHCCNFRRLTTVIPLKYPLYRTCDSNSSRRMQSAL
jgi:Sodium:dicarboxylate symporter family